MDITSKAKHSSKEQSLFSALWTFQKSWYLEARTFKEITFICLNFKILKGQIKNKSPAFHFWLPLLVTSNQSRTNQPLDKNLYITKWFKTSTKERYPPSPIKANKRKRSNGIDEWSFNNDHLQLSIILSKTPNTICT